MMKNKNNLLNITISGWNIQTFNQMNQPIQFTMEVPKVVKPTNKKIYFKSLGTSIINSQMSPPSLQLSCPCTNRLTHRMMTDRHTDRQDNLIVATLPNIINSIEMLNCQNRNNITWMLPQIFMCSNFDPLSLPHPFPSFWIK